MAILEVTGLSKHFGELEVIRDISFSLEKGESLAIIGSSGSGKTTLLRCLTALETPDTGVIRVSGDTVFDAAQPRPKGAQARANQLRFGLVFQSFNLFPQYTALKNVTLAAELLAKERADYKTGKKRILAEIAEKGRAALESVGLSSKADNYPHQLSGGQQQRVAIARALMLEPDILCFDEPTSALDPELTGEVLNVIRSLADRDTTMLIVTHEMQFARQVADNVLFMDGGVIVEYGKAEEVIGNPREERTRRFLERYSNERYSSNG